MRSPSGTSPTWCTPRTRTFCPTGVSTRRLSPLTVAHGCEYTQMQAAERELQTFLPIRARIRGSDPDDSVRGHGHLGDAHQIRTRRLGELNQPVGKFNDVLPALLSRACHSTTSAS